MSELVKHLTRPVGVSTYQIRMTTMSESTCMCEERAVSEKKAQGKEPLRTRQAGLTLSCV